MKFSMECARTYAAVPTDAFATAAHIAKETGLAMRTTRLHLQQLTQAKLVMRVRSPRGFVYRQAGVPRGDAKGRASLGEIRTLLEASREVQS